MTFEDKGRILAESCTMVEKDQQFQTIDARGRLVGDCKNERTVEDHCTDGGGDCKWCASSRPLMSATMQKCKNDHCECLCARREFTSRDGHCGISNDDHVVWFDAIQDLTMESIINGFLRSAKEERGDI